MFNRETAIKAATKHGKHGTRVYRLWRAIKQRCFNPKNPKWAMYGGRGIMMHPEWAESFEAFYRDVGDPPPGKSIDRKENNGHYEPGNIRFVDAVTQANNTRRNRILILNGVVHGTLSEWAKLAGINYGTLRSRIDDSGWTLNRALTASLGEGRYTLESRNKIRLARLGTKASKATRLKMSESHRRRRRPLDA